MYRDVVEKMRESHQREREKKIEAQSVSPIVSSQKRRVAFKSISHRRSIEDVPPWIGWERMLDHYRRCPSQLHKNIFLTLFETGGRVSEVAELKPSNFIWNEEAIKVQGMIVRKWRKHKRRDFLIKIDEKNPLAEDLISFIEECETEYLFPKGKPFSGAIIPDEHTSTTRIYLKVREISDDLWCHWFRAQRASFHVFVRNMDIFQLKDWFMWKSVDMPAHYINKTLRGMAEQMGIEKIPSSGVCAWESR
jgi:integrase